MEREDDEALSQLLQSLSPPERDPMFRIRVLERRERRQFTRKVALLLAAGAVAALAYAIAAAAGGHGILRILGLTVAGVLAAAMYVPALLTALRGVVR